MVIRRLLAEPLGEAKRSRANESARCAWRSTSGARLKSVWSLLVGTGFSLCLAAPAFAQISGADFCESPFVAKVSAPISITSSGAGEHQIVAAVANQVVQVCAFAFDLGGTNPTAEWDYGTKVSTDCDTNGTAMTGAMSAASRTVAGPLQLFTAPAGNQLCLKLGGTSPTAVGWVTYVQK